MISTFFPLKKLRRNTRHLLFLAILLVAIVAVYHEMIASRAWSADNSVTPDNWRRAVDEEWVRRDHLLGSVEYSDAWRFSYTPQTWKPEHMGQANLHVFEDWCGSSVADLRKNMHYPLYPHSRTTVQKLAVSPQWTNYGLRIFGYLHPFTDGEFVFGLSSDDNSEFWLSTDESPLNVQLLAWVGKTGKEWTAPGEFNKYVSQTSRPVWLSAQRRFFFELIHKQNERGTDHVEVAWQLLHQGFRFTVIESRHISLYVNETALLLSDVAHIPQTAASHQHTPTKQHSVTADMQREDPRDTFYRVPLIDSRFLQGVLPDCSYKPSYIIKDFPLQRYQGLQFVHMSYVHPNDYTRLTHMETDNSCFYPESPSYMKMFGFSRYMRLELPEPQGKGNTFRGFHFQKRKSAVEEEFDRKVSQREIRPEQKGNVLFPDYGDDYDDYAQKRRRKLFSLASQEANRTLKNTSNTWPGLESRQGKDTYQNLPDSQKPVELVPSVPPLTANQPLNLQQNWTDFSEKRWIEKTEQIKPKGKLRLAKRPKLKSVERNIARPVDKVPPKTKKQSVSPSVSPKQRHMQTSHRMEQTHIQRIAGSKEDVVLYETATVAKNHRVETTEKRLTTQKQGAMLRQRELNARKHLREKEMEMNIPLQREVQDSIHKPRMIIRERNHKKWLDPRGEEFRAEEKDKGDLRGREPNEGEREWGLGSDVDGTDDEDLTPRPVFDADINWSQTFQFSHMDLQAQRSDWIDLRCNISGNLLLDTIDALPVVKAFVDKLNEKHYGHFTLVRVVNVVMRNDGIQGSRYLLELELKDAHGQLLRLSHYIYALILHSRRRGKGFNFPRSKPQQVLCNPVGFRWNPAATVHFIVPVKNQARWVQQLITDMEQLFSVTGDTNFNLIVTDYNSTDMDVRQALKKSKLPRYEYVKLAGNFERSAGLQAGVDLINDDHSIVFLCDLHIHFPASIIDTIRKHCVEGYMAFAPIVLRLDCGATPADAKGYWEVNGFGLLGIYKSDLVKVGGMNTREFTDRWGGEDWELLDRILQAGLEVERIYLRNFFHHYHSKRGMWNRRIMPRPG